MAESKHTPLPWHVDHDGPSRPIICCGFEMLSISKYENGRWTSYDNEEEDCAYIVKACNGYPELVEALKTILGNTVDNEAANVAEAALFAAGEEL